MSSDYTMTIGIECHVQLATESKLFSRSSNDARHAEPNQNTNPVDFGLPGMLPVLNRQAVELAVKAGKALNAVVAQTSRFDRKHYFYPDLPKGYQTTQMYQPIIGPGKIDVPLPDDTSVTVRIHHAHMEEDAGKLTHFSNYSLVDLNRAGAPLIEIVSEPDIHSAAQARAYAEELHRLMTYAGVTRGDLYHGNMRFDVNVSVAKKDASKLGTRAEVKNLNSFRSVEKAAEYEFHRQVEILETGGSVKQETRGWNDDTLSTTSQRSKEDAQDYRYMPDADIPPIVLTATQIDEIQSAVPKLPPEYRAEFKDLAVDKSVIQTILAHQDYAALVSAVQAKDAPAARRVANWLASRATEGADGAAPSVATDPSQYLALSQMVEAQEISSNAATELFDAVLAGETDVRALAATKNLLQVSDEAAIGQIVDAVMADPASQKSLDDIRAGKDKAIGYLVGQVMKQSRGTANPALAQKLIRDRL